MKIRVAYSKLQSGPGYNNQSAEAEIEVEVNGDPDKAYDKAWRMVREQVDRQLRPEEDVPF